LQEAVVFLMALLTIPALLLPALPSIVLLLIFILVLDAATQPITFYPTTLQVVAVYIKLFLSPLYKVGILPAGGDDDDDYGCLAVMMTMAFSVRKDEGDDDDDDDDDDSHDVDGDDDDTFLMMMVTVGPNGT